MNFFKILMRIDVISYLKRKNLLGLVLGAIDILAIIIGFQVSYMINIEGDSFFFQDKTVLWIFVGCLPFWLVSLYMLEVTEIPRSKRYRVLLLEYIQASAIMLIFFIAIYFIFKLYEVSRLFLVEVSFFGGFLLFVFRIIEYVSFKSYRSKGFNQINVVIIADNSAISFIDSLIEHTEWGYKIVTIFTSSPVVRGRYEEDIIILEEEYLGVLNDLIEGDVVDEVLLYKTTVNATEIRSMMFSCEELGVVFRIKDVEKLSALSNAVRTEIFDEKFLTFTNVPHQRYALFIKNLIDITVSWIMIIVLSPLFLLISLMIKVTSKGPIIFKQERVGLRGRLFNLYKFRTMVVNAEALLDSLKSENEADGPAFKIKHDPRVTKVGAILRKTGLDELPQLFNIVMGEMSLIGPRPPLPSEIKQYKRWQLRRLSVKPGLSCFWQVKPNRNEIKFERWMELDLSYIDNWSLRLDFVIFLKTIRTVFKRTGV